MPLEHTLQVLYFTLLYFAGQISNIYPRHTRQATEVPWVFSLLFLQLLCWNSRQYSSWKFLLSFQLVSLMALLISCCSTTALSSLTIWTSQHQPYYFILWHYSDTFPHFPRCVLRYRSSQAERSVSYFSFCECKHISIQNQDEYSKWGRGGERERMDFNQFLHHL